MSLPIRLARLFVRSRTSAALLGLIALFGALARADQQPTGVGTWSPAGVLGALPDGAAPTSVPTTAPDRAADARPSEAIPMDQLGAMATKQYSGDGLSVVPTSAGARLSSVFQKLSGDATRGGLWVTSTVAGETARLRMMAIAIGRDDVTKNLARSGRVTVAKDTAMFTRGGLVEEYATGVDGVQQDFILDVKPAGIGQLQVHLALEGAKALRDAHGATLTLDGSGRALLYSRLRAMDATGRELTATLDVIEATHLAVRVDDAGAVYPVRIDPTFSDANWVSLNSGMTGVSGTVSATAIDGSGNLYVGGTFTGAGTAAANNIAKWNGTTWSALGSGLNGAVNALAVSGTTLYVGGSFTTAGGVSANNVARWNGTAWSALGSGMNVFVASLAVSGTTLYAIGNFTTAGGVTVNGIAQWNGTAWSALGSGLNGSGVALAVSGTTLYAGGQFTTAGGVPANNIAQWNGSAWSALGSGTNTTVFALAASGTTLYAGGTFTAAGGVAASDIAQWNGSAWSALGSGVNGTVFALAVSGTTLYAGGGFSTAGGVSVASIAQWNGSAWSAVSSGVNGNVSALAVSGTTLYAGGNFTTAGGGTVNDIGQWNGSAWSALGSGMNAIVDAVAVSGTTLYAGGSFTSTTDGPANYIAQWNGSAWSALGTGMNNTVNALAVSGTTLYAGGSFTTAGGTTVNRVAQWNGSAWSALDSGMNSTVTALTVSGSTLYAGGSFTTAGGVSAARVAQWNGSSWSALGAGVSGTVSALAVSGTTLYAGGSFTTAGGVSAAHVAQWNGSAWSALGAGLTATGILGSQAMPNALAVNGTTLYAGGKFTIAGGVSGVSNIAQWNGSAWSALGTGMNNTVFALAVNGTTLYAGGQFTTAGGVAANRIAQWDGTAWTALGSGMDNTVSALATVSTGHLYVGGSFFNAGTTPSPFIAQGNIPGLNMAPVANAGSDQFASATSAGGATVTLNGSGSSDPDGDTITYSWTNDFNSTVLTGATPSITVPFGAHTFTLTVTDPSGLTSTDTIVVTVSDSFTISIVTPPFATALYTYGQVVAASYSCSDSANMLASCSGPVANGANIDTTSSIGSHMFTVTATNTRGDSSSTGWTYNVQTRALTATLTAANKAYDGTTAEPDASMICSLSGVIAADAANVICTATNGSFNLATAGSRTVTATVTISGAASGGYTLGTAGTTTTTASKTATASITAKPVAAAVTAANKTYNGDTNATMTGCTLNGVVSPDTTGCATSATPANNQFASANAGAGVTVTANGITLTNNASGNYALTSTTAVTTASITTAAITATLTAAGKTYDGTTAEPDASMSCSLTGVLAADTGNVACTATSGTFNLATAGSRTVTATVTIGGTASGNYTLGAAGTATSSTSKTATASITAKSVTASVTAANKTYNGNTGVAMTGCTLSGVVSPDTTGCATSATQANNQFASAAVGTGITVTANGITLTNNASGNYALTSTTATTTANITTAAVTASISATSKVYDGTATATVTGCTLTGVLAADTANVTCAATNGAFEAATAGAGTVTATVTISGTKATNYTLGAAGTTLSSSTASVTTDVTADAVYGQSGSFATGTANQPGLNASGLFAPTGIAFDASGGLYVADKSNNRVLFFPSGSTTATRVYGQGGSFTSNGVNTGGVSADSLNTPTGVVVDPGGNLYVADSQNNRVLFYPAGQTTATRVYGQSGNFTTNAAARGVNTMRFPFALALDAAGGLYVSDQGNIRVLYFPANSTTPTRVYGQGGNFGTATGNYPSGTPSADGFSGPEGLALDRSGNLYVADTFNNRVLVFSPGSTTATGVYGQSGSLTTASTNAQDHGTADSLRQPIGVTLDPAGNLYIADFGNSRVLFFAPGSTTATRVYGQLGNFAGTRGGGGSASVLASPDAATLDSNGNLYIADTNNNRLLAYNVAPPAITAAPLTATLTAAGKTYDGTTTEPNGSVTCTLTGVLGADAGKVTCTVTNGTFDSASAGARTVTATVAIGGSAAGNYALASSIATASASITAKNVTASITADSKTYNGTTAATIHPTLSGVIAPDVVTVGGTGTFATKNVGTGKTVTSSDLALGGADAGNYTLTSATATTTADITTKSLTATITADNKTYDGTTAATIHASVAGVIAPDVVTISGTGTFSTKTTGTTKTVTSSNLALSGADAGNYALSSATATTTADIAKANATIAVTGYAVTYDGGAHTATGTAKGVESEDLSALLHVGATTHTSAGDYPEDVWTFDGDTNYNAATGFASDSIAKATSATAVTCADATYTGAAQQTCSATATGAGSLSQPVTVTYTNNTNAGTASATATFAGDGNHDGSTGSAAFTIAKATSTTTVTCTDATYTGAALQTCSATATGAGSLSSPVTVTYTNNTNAGTASATTTFAGDTNHDGSTGSATFTIAKATSTTTVTCTDATYTGAALQTCSATATGAGSLSSSVTVTYTNNTNAGTASATATFAGDANHDGSTGSATFAIAKATSTTTVTCTDATYTGAAQQTCAATATGAGSLSTSVTVAYSNNISAGSASATATFAGDANHDGSTGSAMFTIAKATSTTTVTCADATYTGAAQQTCSATATGAGSLSTAVTVTYTNNTNAGTASATATFAGDTNHDGSTGSATFTIARATSATAVTCSNATYTGAAQETCSATATGAGSLSESVAVTYANNTNAGTASASATFAGDANHDGSTGTATFTIAKATSTTAVTCTDATYTGAAQQTCAATATGTGSLSTAVTVTYANNTNAGTASATATFSGDANHDGSTGSATFTIAKATSATAVTCSNATFTGAAQETCTATATGAGSLSDAVTVIYANNTNAGTASANATFAGDANHDGSTGSATFTIATAGSTTAVSCSPTAVYTGAPQQLCSVTVTGLGGLSLTPAPSYANNTSVGTATASYTFAGDANHDGSTASATFAITKAALSVTANSKTRAALAPNPVFDGTLTGVLGTDGITATYSAVAATLPGTYPIVPTIADPNGRLGNYLLTSTNGTLTVVDTDPPAVVVPASVTAEATSATGALVDYASQVSAVDAVFGPVSVNCAPASGTVFAIGTTQVNCTAVDGAGNTGGASFAVTVRDTTAPTLTTTDITVAATSAAGATVNYAPIGHDLVSGDVPSVCSPTTDTLFAIGDHAVSCTATDAAGNVSTTSTFTVHVLDGVAPTVTVPATLVREATGATGATVAFTATAIDNVDVTLTPTCAPLSGSVFPLGNTTVTCTATDSAHNTGSASFTVTVRDTTAPTLALPVVAPVVSLTPTIAVNYTATASDTVDGNVAISCSPASGSQFPVGSTTVNCTATDAHGNTKTGSFIVKVNDGVAPIVTVAPAGNRVIEATSAAGASVTYTATATDNRDGVLPVTCTPASGAVFPLGPATLVTCRATDNDGNIGTTTFTVTVVDTTAPVLTLPAPITQSTALSAGAAVTYTASALDTVSGSVPVTCAPASGATFPVGVTTVNCSASDTRGNARTGTFTVTVTLTANGIEKFVAFSRDETWLRSNATVVTGDVGANERRFHPHAHNDDDGDRDDVTVRIGQGAEMKQTGSRVVGDTVLTLAKSTIYNVIRNFFIPSTKGTVLGTVTGPMAVPYLALPAFPTVTAGTTKIEVAKNQTLTLPAGSYNTVHVSNGGKLILTGGLYQMLSLDVDQQGTVMFRAATQIRIKTELDAAAKSNLILDQTVAGLRASQMVIYVEGSDSICNHHESDDDGDDAGGTSAHIGQNSVVQANIYALNGTVWLKSKTQATGAFIGVHVRIGQNVTLTLDSAFR